MEDHIKMNTTRFKYDIETINSLIQLIQQEKEKMDSNVKQLEGMWEGGAKAAFDQAYRNDIEALQRRIDSLKIIHEFQSNAKAKYEICERQVEQLVDSIKV